jgi:two-component system sensor kinase FixL
MATIIQLVLIAALLTQWLRSRRSMHQLAERRAGVEARTGDLLHELNQPLTAILSNAQAAQRFLAAAQPDVQELREILNDIVMDDKRAAGIVGSLGQLLEETKVLVVSRDEKRKRSDN